MKFSDFQPEIDAIKKDGYKILEHIVLDYGRTLGLVVEKKSKHYKIMFVECFYDTEGGERTKWHGTLDIRATPWSKSLRVVS